MTEAIAINAGTENVSHRRAKIAKEIAFCVRMGMKCPDFEDGGIAVKAGFFMRRETSYEPTDYALAASKLAADGINIEVYRYIAEEPRLKIRKHNYFLKDVIHDWVKVIPAFPEALAALPDTSEYEQTKLYPPEPTNIVL